jgi:C-terminal peptidase prc
MRAILRWRRSRRRALLMVMVRSKEELVRPQQSRRKGRPLRLAMALSAALLLAGCGWADGTLRPPAPWPSVTAQRATASATPLVRDPRARDGAALIIRALTLLRIDSAAPRGSAELYGTAYAGTVAELRRRGGTPRDAPLALTNDAATDEAIFTAAYLTLAGALDPGDDQAGLAYAAIRAVTARLDECNTYLLTPAEAQQRRITAAQQAGGYGGIGVNLRADAAGATIAIVYPDTPAARAALQPDDRIVAIDRTPLAGSTAEQIGTLLRGPQGSTTMLTIVRVGETATRTIAVTREGIQPPALTSRFVTTADGHAVGVIHLAALTNGAAGELDRALADFAANDVSEWVLDLRGSTGDSPEALVAFAAPILGGGATVAYQVREGTTMALATAPNPTSTPHTPRAVLIDGGTTGMAEALAATLTDNVGTLTIGEATAGCVSLRETRLLPDGAVLSLGVAQLQTPGGRDLARTGQRPKETVLSDPTGTTDPPLLAALR